MHSKKRYIYMEKTGGYFKNLSKKMQNFSFLQNRSSKIGCFCNREKILCAHKGQHVAG